jgi:hypothetical protein
MAARSAQALSKALAHTAGPDVAAGCEPFESLHDIRMDHEELYDSEPFGGYGREAEQSLLWIELEDR